MLPGQISLKIIWRKMRAHHPKDHFLAGYQVKPRVAHPSYEFLEQRLSRRTVLFPQSIFHGMTKTGRGRN